MSKWRFKYPTTDTPTEEAVEHRFQMESRTLNALVDLANENGYFPFVEIQKIGLIEVLRRVVPEEDFFESKSQFGIQARMIHSLEQAIDALLSKGRIQMIQSVGVRTLVIKEAPIKEEEIKPVLKRMAELRTMPYSEYLETPEWQAKRMSALNKANHSCQICNSKKQLNVHHRTYERRGDEHSDDLTVLCRECHETFHGILPLEPKKGWWQV